MSKILILRFSSIGDIVLTTPVIRCLKKQLPGATIHYLTKPAYKSILEHNPYIDHVHVLDKPLLQKALELKQYGFDYIIDLHNNLRTRIIKSIIDAPAFAFDKLNFEKWLLVQWKLNDLPPVHITDRYLQTVGPLGVLNDHEGLDYFIPDGTELPALPPRFIAFAIGAQHATKKLPHEKIAAICQLIDNPVVLLGGKEDAAEAALIVATTGQHVIDLCGRLSLHQSAAVIGQAAKVISHDTGLMHIAAAFKKEVISVWGNTVPEFGMTPYYGKHAVPQMIAEVRPLYCRPCSKIGYKRCPEGHFNCMRLQDEQFIADSAQL